jgi:hypothetical protein
MQEIQQDLTLLAALGVVRSLVWLVCALSALAAFRAYGQRLDLGWLAAFALLSLAAAGHASAAAEQSTAVASAGPTPQLQFAVTSATRMAAFELVAAVVALLVFRRPRLSL